MLLARHIDITTGRIGEPFTICEKCFNHAKYDNLPYNCPELDIFQLEHKENRIIDGTCESCEQDGHIDAVITHKGKTE